MEKEEIKEIRDRLIKAAHDGKIDIPPISRVNIEIIDPAGIPHEVDDRLLEMIENGEEELTDDLFFQLLSENPKYLIYGPFQEKIAAWQAVVRDALWDRETEKEERLKAQDNLKKIGTTLSFVGSGRPRDGKETPIFFVFLQLLQRLEEIMPEIKRRYRYNYQEVAFSNACPDLSEYAELFLKKRKPLSLAKAIIMEKYVISERKLDGIIKDNRKIFPQIALNNKK